MKNLERGFSFESKNLLDMTMGLNTFNAYDLLKNISEKDLKDILKYFGEEKFFSKIARSIINNRDKNIASGKELSDIVNKIKFRKKGTYPATKSFQAIRMIVNQELSEIYNSLKYIIENCKEGAL